MTDGPDVPQPVEDAARAVGSVAEVAAEHPVVQGGARLGYAVSGVLHLLMGFLAVRLALGDHAADPDQSGALATLAGSPFGWALLALCIAGFVLLGAWNGIQVVRRQPTGGSRLKPAAKAVLYLALAGGALGFLEGAAESSSSQTRDATALLMGFPLGTLLVGLTGGAVAGVGLYHVVKGGARRFLRDLREHPSRTVVALGVLGYVAKGLALVGVGVLFVQAAWLHDPSRSTGLDGALSTLLQWPAGPGLVGAIGAGFAAYGSYSFARARYART